MTHYCHIGLILIKHLRIGISVVTKVINHTLQSGITANHLGNLNGHRLIRHRILHGRKLRNQKTPPKPIRIQAHICHQIIRLVGKIKRPLFRLCQICRPGKEQVIRRIVIAVLCAFFHVIIRYLPHRADSHKTVLVLRHGLCPFQPDTDAKRHQ